jgi:hypothetical protein
MNNYQVIAETDTDSTNFRVEQNKDGKYDLFVDNELVQPNHTAEGMIRALMCQLQYYVVVR